MTPAVAFDGVDFSYGRTVVLKQVSFALEPAAFACFVGPNGGGKTTLLRLALGLLHPTRGRVRLFGERPERGRLRMGYVPQDVDHDRAFPVRVHDVVAMGCINAGGRKAEARRADAVRQALEAVGLAECAGRWYGGLSGGQRQRVLLARALASDPEVLVLDEPTASVDPQGEMEILEILERLRGTRTVVLVTHSANVAAHFLDSIYCVNKTVHRHPPTDHMDAALMRHVIGVELPGQFSESRADG
jgi:zinc transport system ATP-binding protein